MLATVVMFGLLIALGGKLVWDEYRFEVTSPGLGEPQWIYTATLPLFSILVVIRAVAWWNTERKSPSPTAETAPPHGAEISAVVAAALFLSFALLFVVGAPIAVALGVGRQRSLSGSRG